MSRQAFIDVQFAQETLALARENAANLQEIVTLNEARVRGGDVAEVELLRSRIAALQSRQAVRSAELRLRREQRRLQRVIGRTPGGAPLEIALLERPAQSPTPRRTCWRVPCECGRISAYCNAPAPARKPKSAGNSRWERAGARLMLILPVTIVIVFGLLFVAFASVRDAALVLVNVPFSLVGGILALYLRGIHLSVSAAVGFVTLFGVAVMGGLLYVAEINRRLDEPGVSLRDTVVSGAKAQVRPMFMLIVVAMLGMIPAAIATGIGSDIQRPLATVIVGGLASTLPLTLLVLPSLYYVTAGGRYRASRVAEVLGEKDHDR